MFIHYANANIHEVSLLDALRSPIFMKYYEAQPFNTNHLRPCPMLENPDDLPKMVAETGAHCTDLVEKETPEQLREKTAPAAAAWKPVAERLWADEADPRPCQAHELARGPSRDRRHAPRARGAQPDNAGGAAAVGPSRLQGGARESGFPVM